MCATCHVWPYILTRLTKIEPTGQVLGATVRGVDLARALGDEDFAAIVKALGRPDEPRLMKRCQVMGDRIFDPAFLPLAGATPRPA